VQQLVELQHLLSGAEKLGTAILAVSVDTAPDLEKMVRKVLAKSPGDLASTLLSDPDHALIDRYGLLNEDAVKAFKRFVPHPTTYVIDRGGVIRWKFTEVNYKIRPSNQMVLDALREAR
jgi:peroxiredoxin